MTGPVRHQENANKAKAELAAVKASASQLIGDLICLVMSMYVFSDDLTGMSFNGRPIGDVVFDLTAAETAKQMQDALASTEPRS